MQPFGGNRFNRYYYKCKEQPGKEAGVIGRRLFSWFADWRKGRNVIVRIAYGNFQ